jgi:hypothetical protein
MFLSGREVLKVAILEMFLYWEWSFVSEDEQHCLIGQIDVLNELIRDDD